MRSPNPIHILLHCWFEEGHQYEAGHLRFERETGRLPTADEIRATDINHWAIEHALNALQAIEQRRWNAGAAGEHRGGYR